MNDAVERIVAGLTLWGPLPEEVRRELLEERPALQPLLDELRSLQAPRGTPAVPHASLAASMPLPAPGFRPAPVGPHPAAFGQPRQPIPGGPLPGMMMPDLAPARPGRLPRQPPLLPAYVLPGWPPVAFPWALNAPQAAPLRPPLQREAAPRAPGLEAPRPPAQRMMQLGSRPGMPHLLVSGSEPPCGGSKRPNGCLAGADAAKRRKTDRAACARPALPTGQAATNRSVAAALRSKLLGGAPGRGVGMPTHGGLGAAVRSGHGEGGCGQKTAVQKPEEAPAHAQPCQELSSAGKDGPKPEPTGKMVYVCAPEKSYAAGNSAAPDDMDRAGGAARSQGEPDLAPARSNEDGDLHTEDWQAAQTPPEVVQEPNLSLGAASVRADSTAPLAGATQPSERADMVIRQAALGAPRRRVAPPKLAPAMPGYLQACTVSPHLIFSHLRKRGRPMVSGGF